LGMRDGLAMSISQCRGTVPEWLWERDCGPLLHFWFTLLPANGSHRATRKAWPRVASQDRGLDAGLQKRQRMWPMRW
jgi:hypothetical protein